LQSFYFEYIRNGSGGLMDDLIADFHIHSKYSHDSLMSPESIVKQAKKVGLTCIAITDHGTIAGGVEGKKVAGRYGVEVIVGAEIKTDCGDIIGLNLNQEIEVTAWQAVVREIRNQGGIVVLPHPYHDHDSVEEIARSVDFIECWNSRCTPEENKKAELLAEISEKKMIYGSDAHSVSEIGLVKVQVQLNPFTVRQVISSRYTPSWEIWMSQIISHIKKHQYRLLVQQGARFLWKKKS
jgi:predicted metal-dependent phosphoesterase TrpH